MKKILMVLILMALIPALAVAQDQKTKTVEVDSTVLQAAVQILSSTPMGSYSIQQVLPIIQELQKSLQVSQFQPAGDIEIETQTKEEEVKK